MGLKLSNKSILSKLKKSLTLNFCITITLQGLRQKETLPRITTPASCPDPKLCELKQY